MPAIAERIKADEHDASDFLAIAVRLLRHRQLDRPDVRAKLAAINERKWGRTT